VTNLLPIEDFVSVSINYPNNGLILLTNGTIINGPLVNSISTSGKKKSNTFNFAFGVFAGMQTAKEIAATIVTSALSIL
jgi:ABC-type uncharacterized transport system YnjBCD ATPase subunit